MKNAKKIVSLAVMMVMVLSMSVCVWAAEKKTAYTFTAGEVQITPGQEFKTVQAALGTAKEIKTLTNCANGGKDKVYEYEDFDIYTTQNAKKVTVVESITLKTDKISTEEGVKLGQLPKDVKKAYPGAEEDMGLYTVNLGNTRIVIDCGIKNDKVVDISYEYYEAKK